MTEFHFNAELAQRYGVDGAIFLHAMAFWVAKNQANGRHFHDGRTWTYNTLEALAKLFPDVAQDLFNKNEADAMAKYAKYKRLAE